MQKTHGVVKPAKKFTKNLNNLKSESPRKSNNKQINFWLSQNQKNCLNQQTNLSKGNLKPVRNSLNLNSNINNQDNLNLKKSIIKNQQQIAYDIIKKEKKSNSSDVSKVFPKNFITKIFKKYISNNKNNSPFDKKKSNYSSGLSCIKNEVKDLKLHSKKEKRDSEGTININTNINAIGKKIGSNITSSKDNNKKDINGLFRDFRSIEENKILKPFGKNL